MSFKKYNEAFSIEIVEQNRRDEFRVRWWIYRIISKLPEDKVKEFCIKSLPPIISENDKDNPFAPEIVEFKNITFMDSPELGDVYIYKVKKETTA